MEDKKAKPVKPTKAKEQSEKNNGDSAPTYHGVRHTGPAFFRRVIVPPNVWVVHTRSGRTEPVHMGLGISFRFNKYTDNYLIAPAAVQTIEFESQCISKEKQGINISALLRWQIEDFEVAYPNLDIQDNNNPLQRFNEQLRQQADAAVKDKIATMGVEEVLTDRRPIVEDLTSRLKEMTEDTHANNGHGLGIRILQVQIKEAWVSSEKLWDSLQMPFRNETDRHAEISQLNTTDQINDRKAEIERVSIERERETELLKSSTQLEIARDQEETKTKAEELRIQEENKRQQLEAESQRTKTTREEETDNIARESRQRIAIAEADAENTLSLEQERMESEAALTKAKMEVEFKLGELAEQDRFAQAEFEAEQAYIRQQMTINQLTSELEILKQNLNDELEELRHTNRINRENQQHGAELERTSADNQVVMELERQKVEIKRLRQEICNLANESDIANTLITALPDIAANLPKPDELRVLQTSGDMDNALATFLINIQTLAESLGVTLPRNGVNNGDSVE